MGSRKSYIIIATSIIGILLYFIFFWNAFNLFTFMSYLSSLATAIMVLVYLFTFSDQMEIIKKQLNEMQFSRELSELPLLIATPDKVVINIPKFYYNPFDHYNTLFEMKIDFFMKLLNIGNDPAVTINVIGNLCYLDSGIIVRTEESYISAIPYLFPNKEFRDFYLGFHDLKRDFIEGIFSHPITPILILEIYYKNGYGGCFREEVKYRCISSGWEDDLKEYLKIIKTHGIDYKDIILQYNKLATKGKQKEALELLDIPNTEIENSGIKREIMLKFNMVHNSFHIKPIQTEEYDTALSKRKYFLEYMNIPTEQTEKSKNWYTQLEEWKKRSTRNSNQNS